jgi:thiamine kinase-like enzyme
MNCVKLAILETALQGKTQLEDFYKRVFLRLGYETQVIDLTPIGTNIKDGDKLFQSELIDVFVSDLSLGKTESYEGLRIIQYIKKTYPNLLVIAHSRTNITLSDASRYIPSFDIFVHKTKMHDSKYENYIYTIIKHHFARNIYLNHVEVDLNTSKLFKGSLGKNRIHDILRTITFTSHNIDPSTAVCKIELIPMLGGYSGSEVYKMTAYTEENLKCINAVLKVSDIENYIEEKENYLKYVKWYLPYTWRPELIGFCEMQKFGALCYSFAYNDDIPFKSLTEYLTEGHIEKLELAIDGIFSPNHQRWYHESNQEQGNNLTKYYYEKLHLDRNNEQMFTAVIKQHGSVETNIAVINGSEYILPEQLLLGVQRNGYGMCICHGDLNSNNILISDDNVMSFIDFQSTKLGHIFEDFIAFESSIRLHINFKSSFDCLLKNEYNLNVFSNDWHTDFYNVKTELQEKVYRLILKLRYYAVLNAPNEILKNYNYALALYCYRLLRVKHLKTWQKEQLVACVLSNGKIIQELENYNSSQHP